MGYRQTVRKEKFLGPNAGLGPMIEDALRNVLEMAKEMSGARQGGIMFYDPDQRLLSLQYPAFDVRREMVDEYKVRVDGVGAAVKAFNTRQPFISNRCVGDPGVIQRYVEMYRVEKLMSTPLECGPEVIGVWHLSNKQEGDWEAGDAERFRVLARRISGLIEQTRQATLQERRYQIWLSLMLKLAENGDVQSVAEVLAQAINAFVMVLDHRGICRARAGRLEGGRMTDPLLNVEKSTLKFRGTPGQVLPVLENGLPAPAWVIPLPAGKMDKLPGYLWILAAEECRVDQILLNQAAHVLAVALANEDRLAGIVEALTGEFLTRLLTGTLDKTEAYLRGGRLGLDLSRQWTILLAVPDRAPTDNEEVRKLWQQLITVKNFLQEQLVSPHPDYWPGVLENCSLLVLVSRSAGSPEGTKAGKMAEMLLKTLARLAGETAFSVGIGEMVCEEPAHYPEAYQEVKWTVEIGRKMYGPGKIFRAGDFGAGFLLYEAGRAGVSRNFVDRLLGGLAAYDQKHNSQYMATLETYLETGGNLAATARLLHTHVNTIRYRLERIEQITGRSLKNPGDRFDFQVALNARKLRD
ncbi:MAG: helix-turn-helix domain-containing protein [Armatimonadetes bacterium]|nr:helix-turn-helix domain-containing protein [Armatimonadota bacterium]